MLASTVLLVHTPLSFHTRWQLSLPPFPGNPLSEDWASHHWPRWLTVGLTQLSSHLNSYYSHLVGSRPRTHWRSTPISRETLHSMYLTTLSLAFNHYLLLISSHGLTLLSRFSTMLGILLLRLHSFSPFDLAVNKTSHCVYSSIQAQSTLTFLLLLPLLVTHHISSSITGHELYIHPALLLILHDWHWHLWHSRRKSTFWHKNTKMSYLYHVVALTLLYLLVLVALQSVLLFPSYKGKRVDH